MRQLALATALLLVVALFPTHIYADQIRSSSAELTSTQTPIKTVEDIRVTALQNIFTKYNSPLFPYAKAYVVLADKYGVDWKLLPSIAGLESSFGKALLSGTHNAYGWGGGTIYFKSWEDGIEIINKAIKENYYNKWNAVDVWTIGPIYAESPTWSVRVNKFIQEINAQYITLDSQSTLKPNL